MLILQDLDILLETDLPPTSTFNKKDVAICQYMITKSFLEDIEKLLRAPIYDESPNDIVTALRTRIRDLVFTDADILILKGQALSMDSFETIAEYVVAHVRFQTQLIDANAPGYTNTDPPAIKLILQVLMSNKRYADIVPTMYLPGRLASVDELRVRLKLSSTMST